MVSDRNNRRDSARSRVFMLVRTPNHGSLWACDIGLGGMSCRAQQLMLPGTYLDMAFTLPGTGDALSIGAQVVGLDQGKDGGIDVKVRFCRVPDNARLALYRFLDRRRYLWEDKKERLTRLHPKLAAILDRDEPFAELLREAYGQLKLKALRSDGKTVMVPLTRRVA